MNCFMLLQASESVIQKSAEMAERDPHGVIITIVSVSVVFCSLIILYYAYTFIGKILSGELKLTLPKRRRKTADKSGQPEEEVAAAIALALDQELNGETYAAIGMALHQYLNDTVQDNESYIITIKRRK